MKKEMLRSVVYHCFGSCRSSGLRDIDPASGKHKVLAVNCRLILVPANHVKIPVALKERSTAESINELASLANS